MLTRFRCIAGLFIAGVSLTTSVNAETVKAHLTGMDCSGDYCQLQYKVDNKLQQAVCADEVYCEKWADSENFPASVQNKPATLHLKREILDGDKTESTIVHNIEL